MSQADGAYGTAFLTGPGTLCAVRVMGLGRFLSPRRHLAMLGDIFDCHHSGRGCYWHLEARGQRCCFKHPTMHSIAPPPKELSGPKYQ